MKKIVNWLDNNIVSVLAGLLVVFIPLYPKWPLFDILYGYNVRVRLEDFFVAASILIFLVQFLRKKLKISWTPVSIGLIVYLVCGFLSVLSSIFWAQTVPLEYLHVAKTTLHWLRRVEYFSLFFVFFVSIKSWKQVRIYLLLIALTFLGVIIYGYGQKYLYWPAFSTMNREFAKGWWLYLTEHARVLSTFGGHYDLAGYLVITLTACWSFFFGFKNIAQKVGVGLLIASGFWLLILTASRASFLGYIVGLTTVVSLWTFRKGLGWGISRWFLAVGLSMLIMLSFGDLSDRFLTLVKLDKRFNGLRAVLLQPATKPPENQAIFLENNIAAVTSKSDQPPTPSQPSDVTGKEIPLLIPAKTASGATILVEKPRTYSQNALMYDLSTGIRLDSTWPRAIVGFKTNVLFGSGYATLTKNNKYEYTEGESTDSDYLRALGETGLTGFLSFFGTIIIMMIVAFKSLGGLKDPEMFALVSGFMGLTLGLLANAIMIDIFVSSKVAYVFWGVSGLVMGTIYAYREKISQAYEPLRIHFNFREFFVKIRTIINSDTIKVLFIVLLAIVLRCYKLDSPIADWHSWRQADTSAVTRDFQRHHVINWLYPTYDDLSSIASGKPNPAGYRMVEFPIYNAASVFVGNLLPEFSIEEAGRFTTALISSLAVIFLFLILRQTVSRSVAFLSVIVFALLPYNIFYGRTTLPDPSMVTVALGGLWYGLSYSINKKPRTLILFIVFSAFALLLKPYAIFILAPVFYFWFLNNRFDIKKWLPYVIYFLLAALPLVLWRLWIIQFPEGIPANSWLLNGDGIRLKGAFWYWIFADRIGKLILGYWGLIPLAFGWVKTTRFVKLFTLSTLLYLFIFATGNVRHDYYQILIIPAISILLGIGFDHLLTLSKFLAMISLIFMLGFGWYNVRDFYNVNHPELMIAGQKVKELTDWRAKVVAPYSGDTAFLYQTDRKGWPIMEGTIEQMIEKGAQYYVSVKDDELNKKILADSWQRGVEVPIGHKFKYWLLAYTDEYTIVQLVPDSKLPK